MARKKPNADAKARLELSIPADLKRRLAEAERNGINFNLSQIAEQAFEDRLVEVGSADLDAEAQVLIRRIHEQIAPTRFDRASGMAVGRRWARDLADLADLRGLEALTSAPGWDREPDADTALLATRIYHALKTRKATELPDYFWCRHMPKRTFMEGPEEPGRREVKVTQVKVTLEYWKVPHEYFVGFAAGAMELWGKIKHLV
jgi:hypothetical protein